MYNIIIFSGCGLMRFSLKKIATEVISKETLPTVISEIIVSSEFNDFMDLLIQKNNVICVFDVDNISIKNQEKVFSLIRARFSESSLMVLWKGSELGFYHNFLQSNTASLLSKSVTMCEISNKLHDLIKIKNKIKESKDTSKTRDKTIAIHGLTQRQSQVLKFIMLGMNNKEIARKLGISDKTVSAHRTNIYDKYNVKNAIGLYYKVNEAMLH
ncbi:response regulator transcription factor [Yersinia mollaretii]|uniref:response regulator transcription factor n=1 Tax=Yersinia mollaretii TaxID=33060 RepID=UPI0005E7A323|nr:LuxR C-terminal-related transcriptional regulator [Yersinia mollaretii]CNK97767.1 LuxR family transcriptional regulatory protein [Yersinia enterocolitica]